MHQTVLSPRSRFPQPHAALDSGLWAYHPHTITRVACSLLPLQLLWLRPWRHAEEQQLAQCPEVIRQSSSPRGRLRLPALGRARAERRLRLEQRLTSARVRQHEIVRDLI